MGRANDYDTEPIDEDVAGSDAQGFDDEQWKELQEQLGQLGHLRIADEDEEEAWVDPSGGVLVNIYAACEAGDTDKLAVNLAELQQSEHSIDTPGPDGDTALHLACLYGHMPCVEALLAAGCRLDPVNSEDGTTPLHDAAAGGYLGITTLLLDRAGGGLVAVQDSDGDTALHNAARGNHLPVVLLLLQHGADPSVRNIDRRTPAAESDAPEVVAALVQAAQQRQAAAAAAPATAQAAGGPDALQQQQQQLQQQEGEQQQEQQQQGLGES